MNDQPSLFDPAPVVAPESSSDTESAYREFLRLNPWVLPWFEQRALALVQKGHKRIGINMLCEVFRYEQMRSTNDPNAVYKINNNYAPYLARELTDKYPELAEAFEFRRSRADEMHDMTSAKIDPLSGRSIAAMAYDF